MGEGPTLLPSLPGVACLPMSRASIAQRRLAIVLGVDSRASRKNETHSSHSAGVLLGVMRVLGELQHNAACGSSGAGIYLQQNSVDLPAALSSNANSVGRPLATSSLVTAPCFMLNTPVVEERGVRQVCEEHYATVWYLWGPL